jgi:hypothetical protein
MRQHIRSTELNFRTGAAIKAAKRAPVFIQRFDVIEAVLISPQMFKRLAGFLPEPVQLRKDKSPAAKREASLKKCHTAKTSPHRGV